MNLFTCLFHKDRGSKSLYQHSVPDSAGRANNSWITHTPEGNLAKQSIAECMLGKQRFAKLIQFRFSPSLLALV